MKRSSASESRGTLDITRSIFLDQSGLSLVSVLMIAGLVTVSTSTIVMNVGRLQMSNRFAGTKAQRDSIVFASQSILSTSEGCSPSMMGIEYSFTDPMGIPKLILPNASGVAADFLVPGLRPQTASFNRAPVVTGMRLIHFMSPPGTTQRKRIVIPPATTSVEVDESVQLALMEMTFADDGTRVALFSFLPVAVTTRQKVGVSTPPTIISCKSNTEVLKSLCGFMGSEVDLGRNACRKTLPQAASDAGCAANERLAGARLNCAAPSGQRIAFACTPPGTAPATISATEIVSCQTTLGTSPGGTPGGTLVTSSTTTNGITIPGSGAVLSRTRPVDVIAATSQAQAILREDSARIGREATHLQSQKATAEAARNSTTTTLASTTDPGQRYMLETQVAAYNDNIARLEIAIRDRQVAAALVQAQYNAVSDYFKRLTAALAANPTITAPTLIANNGPVPPIVAQDLIKDNYIEPNFTTTNPTTGEPLILTGKPSEVPSTGDTESIFKPKPPVVTFDPGVTPEPSPTLAPLEPTPTPEEQVIEQVEIPFDPCAVTCELEGRGGPVCQMCVSGTEAPEVCDPAIQCCNGIGNCPAAVPTPTPLTIAPEVPVNNAITYDPPYGLQDQGFTKQDYFDYFFTGYN
jgi:hypothetical protein